MSSSQYTSTTLNSAPVVERVLLPTQVINKSTAIHEEIRREVVEEIQPVINVEKYKTEVHQVTQPLFDKEVKNVTIENRTLATEILPEVLVAGRGVNMPADVSTTKFLDTKTVVVEKPAMFHEIERRQIIEEIQPVIYKETVVPEVIQETKPIYQKITEGPVYSHSTMASRQVANPSLVAAAYVPDNTALPSTQERLLLPTQIVEKPAAIHEEIRKEVIEEIQPVINVEKIKTEVHQITAPLYDKEIRPVEVQQRTLATEVLPEVLVQGRGVRHVDDVSTTVFQSSKAVVIEKPARMVEIERTQIIEEIQPVVYKETVVPHVIRETKPVFQKIVEGPVYSQETLPARNLRDTNYVAPRVVETIIAPVMSEIPIYDSTPFSSNLSVQQPYVAPHRELVQDTVSVTTTTTTTPIIGSTVAPAPQKHRGLFHRHSKENMSGVVSQQPATNLAYPETHTHTEKILPSGTKVVQDTTSTRTVNRV